MNPIFFVSHASTDSDLTGIVANAIEASGGIAYVAEDDHQAGQELPDKLVQAIRQCDAFVVLLTDAGISSDMVRREVTLARAELKWIIPLVTPEVALTEGRVPALLGLMEWVPFDPNHPIGALANLTGLITRYRDSLVAKEVRELGDRVEGQGMKVASTSQQISTLQNQNAMLKNEEMVLLAGVILLGALVIILASSSGGLNA